MTVTAFNLQCFIIKEDVLFKTYDDFLKLITLLKKHALDCNIHSFGVLMTNLETRVKDFHPCYIVGNFNESSLKWIIENQAKVQRDNVYKYFNKEDQRAVKQWFTDLKESDLLKKLRRLAVRFYKLAKESPPNIYESTLVYLTKIVSVIDDCAKKISEI